MLTPRRALSLACLLLAACNEAEPDVRLYAGDVDVLTEVLLLEATLQDYAGAQRDSLTALYYDQLYDRFGLDEPALDAMRVRLSEYPQLWQRAVDSVSVRLDSGRARMDYLVGPSE